MTIDDLPAGRGLDALVAEQVMGWQWRAWNNAGIPERALFAPERCLPESESWDLFHVYQFPNTLASTTPANFSEVIDYNGTGMPHFSADIADAWKVVEKVRMEVGPSGDQWWAAAHEDGDIDCRSWMAYAPTAPLAICRAALKAVEQESAVSHTADS